MQVRLPGSDPSSSTAGVQPRHRHRGSRVRKRRNRPRSPTASLPGIPLCPLTRSPTGAATGDHQHRAYGSLPIMPEVVEEALRRGVDITALPTEDACRLIASLDENEVHAVLHVTC